MKSIWIAAVALALLVGMIVLLEKTVGASIERSQAEEAKHPPEYRDGIREFTRADGTVCVYNWRGGITCNWKN